MLLALLIAIIFFATSALCNQCSPVEGQKIGIAGEEGSGISQEETEGAGTGTAEEGAAEEEEEAAEEEPAEEEEEEEEEEVQNIPEEPTIELQVYEGPIYSQADDLCYWRVRAIVTGVPTPVVEFNRDDGNGAWGSKKAQVNLANPTDSYSLSATATNSEGVATDSILLPWECNRDPEISDITMMGDHFVGIEYTISASASDPDGDTLSYLWSVTGGSLDSSTGNPVKWTMPATAGDYQVTVQIDDGNGGMDTRTETVEVMGLLGSPIAAMDLPIISSEGGRISGDGIVHTGVLHRVGDTSSNFAVKGFISFDITGLYGGNVESAELTVNLNGFAGDCSLFTPLWIMSANWESGNSAITAGDFNISGDPIQGFNTYNFSTDAPELKQYLQDAINTGRNRFQLVMFFTGMATDNDGLYDIWDYTDNLIRLNVTYTP